MKRLLVVLIVLLSMNVFANDFGVKIGLNYSLFKEKNLEENTSFAQLIGGSLGVFKEIDINEYISFKGEVLLINSSYSTRSQFTDSEVDADFAVFSIEIPLLLTIKGFTDLHIGGYLNKVIYNFDITGHYADRGINWAGNYDYGIILGTSYYINKDIFVDLMFSYGFADMYSANNKRISMSVGYSF